MVFKFTVFNVNSLSALKQLVIYLTNSKLTMILEILKYYINV